MKRERTTLAARSKPGREVIAGKVLHPAMHGVRSLPMEDGGRLFYLLAHHDRAIDFREAMHIAGNREDFVKIGKARVRLFRIIHGEECFLQRPSLLSGRTDLASLYKQRGRVAYTPLERGDM